MNLSPCNFPKTTITESQLGGSSNFKNSDNPLKKQYRIDDGNISKPQEREMIHKNIIISFIAGKNRAHSLPRRWIPGGGMHRRQERPRGDVPKSGSTRCRSALLRRDGRRKASCIHGIRRNPRKQTTQKRNIEQKKPIERDKLDIEGSPCNQKHGSRTKLIGSIYAQDQKSNKYDGEG